jgi:hypothetical protein
LRPTYVWQYDVKINSEYIVNLWAVFTGSKCGPVVDFCEIYYVLSTSVKNEISWLTELPLAAKRVGTKLLVN